MISPLRPNGQYLDNIWTMDYGSKKSYQKYKKKKFNN